MPRASMVGDNEHTQTIGGLYSLIGQMSIDGGRVKDLHEPSVKMRWTDSALFLGRKTHTREGSAESGRPSLTSGNSTV